MILMKMKKMTNLLFPDEKNEPEVKLDNNLKIVSGPFQFIIVDECHRSIYGKWQSVLKYFKGQKYFD